MECGCRIVQREVPRPGDPFAETAVIRFCPLHAAAPELLEACKAAQQVLNSYIEGEIPRYHPGLADQKLANAIAKAEGGGVNMPSEQLFHRYRRALESLTPSGSEFVNDPERCARYVLDARQSQMAIIRKYKLQRDQLLEACKCSRRVLDNITIVLPGWFRDGADGGYALDRIRAAIAKTEGKDKP